MVSEWDSIDLRSLRYWNDSHQDTYLPRLVDWCVPLPCPRGGNEKVIPAPEPGAILFFYLDRRLRDISVVIPEQEGEVSLATRMDPILSNYYRT